jgi:hypothetical protein
LDLVGSIRRYRETGIGGGGGGGGGVGGWLTAEVTLSMILKWYGADFGEKEEDLLRFVSRYLEDDAAAVLKAYLDGGNVPRILYAPYDWRVNAK